MKKLILAAGHICLDITPVFSPGRKCISLSELLIPGRLVHMEGADVHTGGSVANTGLALKILGNEVRLLGKVGEDAFGSMIRSILSDYGVSGLLTDTKARTSYSVVLAAPGFDRIFLHDPGANDCFCSQDIPESALDDAVLFHFGYPPLMRKMYENDGAELTAMFRRVKEHGIATSLDFAAIDPDSEAGRADWQSILSAVLPYVDFFVPSFEELLFMLDGEHYAQLAARGGDMTEDLDLEKEAVPLTGKLLEMGCRAVLIKCGTSGMVYRTADPETMKKVGSRLELDLSAWSERSGVRPCFRADALRSGTGAGDTSIAAFLTAVLLGKTPEECTALAAAEGACCVTAYDALSGLKSIPELEARVAAGWQTGNPV
ncbi:MAG: carbohydrate kinase family protein [Oscillospiraceae bacterium]|nr:carbohydrate kinase family protein [Oscillospiraceae bacterium]